MNPDDLVEFDGSYYKKSDLTEEQIRHMQELDEVADAAVTGKKVSNFLTHLPALINLALMTQVGFRKKLQDELRDKEVEIHKH